MRWRGWGWLRRVRLCHVSRVTQVKTQHLAEKTNLQAVLFFVKLFRLFFYFFFSFFFYSIARSISNSYRRCQLTHSECHVTKEKLVLHLPAADAAVAFFLFFLSSLPPSSSIFTFSSSLLAEQTICRTSFISSFNKGFNHHSVTASVIMIFSNWNI